MGLRQLRTLTITIRTNPAAQYRERTIGCCVSELRGPLNGPLNSFCPFAVLRSVLSLFVLSVVSIAHSLISLAERDRVDVLSRGNRTR